MTSPLLVQKYTCIVKLYTAFRPTELKDRSPRLTAYCVAAMFFLVLKVYFFIYFGDW